MRIFTSVKIQLLRPGLNPRPWVVRDKSVPILFADEGSILLSHSNPTDLFTNINTVFKILSDQPYQNLLFLNFTKTQFNNCTTKNNNEIEININYNNNNNNKCIPTIT
jgi:hypothetical protein